MLPTEYRLRRSEDFSATVRRGQRRGSRLLVLHVLGDVTSAQQVRVGFVVSKQVGNAVTRNRVQRRLRHLMRERLEQYPQGARLVVRALPASASASYTELGQALDRCWAGAS